MNEDSTLLKVPVFNDKEKNFHSLWIKFQAYSRVKDFHKVLKDAGITITEDGIKMLVAKPSLKTGGTSIRTEGEEEQLKLAKKNLTAMAHLTVLFGSELVNHANST